MSPLSEDAGWRTMWYRAHVHFHHDLVGNADVRKLLPREGNGMAEEGANFHLVHAVFMLSGR